MVSNYFNNNSSPTINQQRLLEDLVNESIHIMGSDIWYIPRDSYNSADNILGEMAESKFEKAYHVEAYLANVHGWEGDGDFFSKFGLEIRDTTNIVVARKNFERYVPSTVTTRPKEGDLIYLPTMQKLLEIKFVEEELMFFSLGKSTPFIYELRCDVFRWSNERIDTGVSEIDQIETDMSYTIKLNLSTAYVGVDYNIGETVYQGANLAYATAQAEVKDWDRSGKHLYVINIKGQFEASSNLVGVGSGTIYNATSADTLGDNTSYELTDNGSLQSEANSFIDLTETNPFGSP